MTSCDGTTCKLTCTDPGVLCNAGMACQETASWDFELRPGSAGWSVSCDFSFTIGVNTDRPSSGTHSLSVTMSPLPDKHTLWVRHRLCDTTGGGNIRGKTMTYRVYLDSTTAPATGHTCFAEATTQNTCAGCVGTGVALAPNKWVSVPATFADAAATAVTELTLRCTLAPGASGWMGTLYVDQITLQ